MAPSAFVGVKGEKLLSAGLTPDQREHQSRPGFLVILSILSILFVPFSSSILVAISHQSSASPAAVEALLKQGKVNEALPLLLQLHRSQPQNSQVCLQLGMAYTQLQQLDKAADFYGKALKINPGITPARRNLATLLWFLNRKAESVREFSSLLKLNPNDSIAHFYLGTFDFEQKEFLRARDHFAKAGDLAFGNPEALPMVLEAYLAVKDMTVPNRMMRQLEQAEKPDTELIFQVGTLLTNYGVYDEAIKAFEKLTSTNLATPATYLMLAEAYDKQGRPEDAYRALAKAIELEPNSEDGYLALAHFSADHQNKAFALKTLGEGLKRLPDSSRLLVDQGVLWALEGNLVKAEASFLMASQADPKWVVPILALGISQLQAGRLDDATSSFQHAAKIQPSDYRPEYLYGLTLSRQVEQGASTRRDEIISALQKATTLAPNQSEPRILLGKTYLAVNQLDEAVEELEKAINLDPQNAAAHYQLGIAYRRQGKVVAAQRELQLFEALKAKLRQEEDEERRALVQILKVTAEK
jgi:superkiller protein 3